MTFRGRFSYYQRKRNRNAVFSRGTLTFATNPGSGDTITLGGTVITLTGYIGAKTNDTLNAVATALNNSTDAGVSQVANGGVLYQVVANIIYIWGNSLASKNMTVVASAATYAAPSTYAKLNRQRVPL